MNRAALWDALQLVQGPVSSSTAVQVLAVGNDGGALLSYGTSVPTAVAGYVLGGLFIHTDAASAATCLYKNTGTAASCTFTAVDTASITGGTATELTELSVRSTGAAFDLLIATTAVYDADRTLTVNIPTDGNATITLVGNLTTAGGAYNCTLTMTGSSNVTLPTTGTLATLTGTETFTNKTLSDSTTTVGAVGALTKAAKFSLSGATAAKTATLTFAHTDDRAITFPDATCTLTGKDTADVLTNKTLDCDGTGNVVSNVNANELDPITPGAATFAVPFVLAIPFANLPAAGVDIFTDNAPFAFRVIDAYVVNTSATGGTLAVHNGKVGALGTAITDTMTLAASDKAIVRAATIDDGAADAVHTIAANGSLCLVGDGGNAADGIAYITCVRVN